MLKLVYLKNDLSLRENEHNKNIKMKKIKKNILSLRHCFLLMYHEACHGFIFKDKFGKDYIFFINGIFLNVMYDVQDCITIKSQLLDPWSCNKYEWMLGREHWRMVIEHV